MNKVKIKRDFGEFHLNVAFESESRRIGILGASGCGKTMTLKGVAGIERIDEGYIEIDGNVLVDTKSRICLKPQKRRVGYLFQNYALFPMMTVEENIAAGLRAVKAEKKKKVKEMIRRFQLVGLEKQLPNELSGGQQQRVALARIMAYEPDILLLDEPFSALDSYLKDRLQQELMDILKDYNGIVIMVSHDRDEIYKFCEELLVIDNGSTITYGKTKEIFLNPRFKATAKLTGCKNFSKMQRINSNSLFASDWGIKIYTKQTIPENIMYIGYRAQDFIPIWGKAEDNCISVKIQSEAELPFEKQYCIESTTPNSERICWFVQREIETKVKILGVPDYLKLDEDKILFLES